MLLASDFTGAIPFALATLLGPAVAGIVLMGLGLKWRICLLLGGVLNILYSLYLLTWFAFFMGSPPAGFFFGVASLPLVVGGGGVYLWTQRRR